MAFVDRTHPAAPDTLSDREFVDANICIVIGHGFTGRDVLALMDRKYSVRFDP